MSNASGGGGYQTPNWAYRIDSAFPAYGSPHGGTQVTGTTSVNDFLSGQANGSRHAYAALLDPSGNLQPARHPRRMDQLPIPVARRRWWRRRRWTVPHRRNHRDHRSGRKRRSKLRLACIHLLRIGRRRIPDAQLGLSDRFGLPGLRITPRRNPSHRTTTSVNDFLSGQANGSRHAIFSTALLDPSWQPNTTRPSPTTHGSTTSIGPSSITNHRDRPVRK